MSYKIANILKLCFFHYSVKNNWHSNYLLLLPKSYSNHLRHIFIESFKNDSNKPIGSNKPIDSNEEQKIMLMDEHGKILGVKTKKEAQQLAKKSRFILVEQKSQTITKYPIYQFNSISNMIAHENVEDDVVDKKEKKKPKFNELKRMALTSRSSDHDLVTKMKQIKKWLQREHEIRVVITGKENEKKILVMML